MAKPKSPTLSYRFITWALLPAALSYTLFTAIRFKKPAYFYQRLANYRRNNKVEPPIWCHCASVGEIKTAMPVLDLLVKQGESVIVSTNTVTGYETISSAQLKNIHQVFLPLDYVSLAQHFIKKFRPKLCLIFETELWPNIFLTALNNNIRVAILNGRISDKTLNAPAFLLKNYNRILSNSCSIIASSIDNKNRFISLGADPSTVVTADNLKFASINADNNITHPRPLRHRYLLCASTHEGEEDSIIRSWLNHPQKQLGLVIAMRHPQRVTKITRLLDHLNCDYSLHSDKNCTPSVQKVHLIDTIGELAAFFKHAEVVFMGGSLVPVGGHNLIEPAQFQRCLLTGPHHEHFREIVNDLIACRAIDIVQNAEQLIIRSLSLVSNDAERTAMGYRAYDYIESKKNVLMQYQQVINNLVNVHKS